MPVTTAHSTSAHGLIVGHLKPGANGQFVQTLIKRRLRNETHVTRSTVSYFEADDKPNVPGDVVAAMLNTDIKAHTMRAHTFVNELEKWVMTLTDQRGRRAFKRVDHW